MAPTPLNNDLTADPTATATIKPQPYWNTTNIAFTAIAGSLTLCVILGIALFLLHRRRQRTKLAAQSSLISDKAGLLSGNERKSNMFSRERHSSVTVFVDSSQSNTNTTKNDTDTAYKPIPQTAPTILTPLHIASPYNGDAEPNNASADTAPSSLGTTTPPNLSLGSGVSSLSQASRTSSGGSLGLSRLGPVPDVVVSNSEAARTATRPRSVSTSSVRYYQAVRTDPTIPVPKIVHTMSD